jgi:hypothetical protein
LLQKHSHKIQSLVLNQHNEFAQKHVNFVVFTSVLNAKDIKIFFFHFYRNVRKLLNIFYFKQKHLVFGVFEDSNFTFKILFCNVFLFKYSFCCPSQICIFVYESTHFLFRGKENKLRKKIFSFILT